MDKLPWTQRLGSAQQARFSIFLCPGLIPARPRKQLQKNVHSVIINDASDRDNVIKQKQRRAGQMRRWRNAGAYRISADS